MSYWNSGIYTKTMISRAGTKLTKSMCEQSLGILNDFRYAHEEITKEMLEIVSKHPLVKISSRRLKRTPSIVHKINRSTEAGNPTALSRMQDIGGCRCVFDNIKDMYSFIELVDKDLSDFKFYKKYDYINKSNDNIWEKGPKSDGYRGIHLIYTYKSDSSFGDLFVELQLRTKLQHSWATAVEIIDLMNDSKLKFGGGQKDCKDFFRFISAIFADKEGFKQPNKNKALRMIPEIIKNIDILDILSHRAISYNFVRRYEKDKRKDSIQGDMILEIHRDSKGISVKPYHGIPASALKKTYLELEKEYHENINVVIVYLSSDEIEKAYPNYVSDASFFLQECKSLLN